MAPVLTLRGPSVSRLLICLLFASATACAAELALPDPGTGVGELPVALSFAEFIDAARLQIQTTSPQEALGWLLQFEQELAGEPAYDYLLGVAALESGKYSLALHALERVTLRLPGHAGAWIDLAIVHIRLGDYQSAEALLQHVEATFSPPPGLASEIRAARQQLAAARRNATWHGEIGIQAGRSSNANAGIAVTGLTLTPVGSLPVYLEIDPSRRPRADATLQWRTLLTHLQTDPDGSSGEWLFLARGKEYSRFHDYETRDFGAAYTQERPLAYSLAGALGTTPGAGQAPAPLRLALGGGLQHLQLGGSPLVNLATLNASLRQPLGACAITLRGEYERRQYLAAGPADADITLLGTRAWCGNATTLVSLGARTGQDRPAGHRPGGPSRRHEISLDFYHALRPGLTLEGLWYHSRTKDAEGYSPLLEDNSPRAVRRSGWRTTLSLDLPWEAPGRWALQGTLDQASERANIALFNLRETQLLLGLRYRF